MELTPSTPIRQQCVAGRLTDCSGNVVGLCEDGYCYCRISQLCHVPRDQPGDLYALPATKTYCQTVYVEAMFISSYSTSGPFPSDTP